MWSFWRMKRSINTNPKAGSSRQAPGRPGIRNWTYPLQSAPQTHPPLSAVLSGVTWSHHLFPLHLSLQSNFSCSSVNRLNMAAQILLFLSAQISGWLMAMRSHSNFLGDGPSDCLPTLDQGSLSAHSAGPVEAYFLKSGDLRQGYKMIRFPLHRAHTGSMEDI